MAFAVGMPKAVFIIDSKKEDIAVNEANKVGMPVFALCNTDCDISKIDYPIMCNEASANVIKDILLEIRNSLR